MSIPEEMIMSHLNMLLSSSEPGGTMHHLHVVAAPADAVGPFGLPDESKLQATVYAIAPDGSVDADQFIAKVATAAFVEHTQRDEIIQFAALSQEAWAVTAMDDLARKLKQEGRLFDHPDMAEVTMVYAACRDGRRWRGRHWLTGPKAGQTEDVELLVGRPRRGEGFGTTAEPFVRKLVGLN